MSVLLESRSNETSDARAARRRQPPRFSRGSPSLPGSEGLYRRRREFHVGHDLPSCPGDLDRRLGEVARRESRGADAVRPHHREPNRRDQSPLALARPPSTNGAARRTPPWPPPLPEAVPPAAPQHMYRAGMPGTSGMGGMDSSHMMPGMLTDQQ